MQRLTPKEKIVAGMLAQGFNGPGIAEVCGLTTNTVKMHLSRIYLKLDVPDRPELDKRVKLGVYLNCELFKIGLHEMQAA